MKRYLLPVHIIIVALVIGWFALGSNPLITVAANNAVVTATTQISVCGNDIKEGGEQCDGSDIGGRICTYLGYDSGTLACNSACQFDTSSCNTNAKETAIPLFSQSIGGNYTVTDSVGGDSLNISLPARFYSQDVRLQMFIFGKSIIAISKPAPSGKSFVGDIYLLLFTGPNGNIVSTLSKPSTITLSYASADINGINPDTLSPYQRKDGDTSWYPIVNYSLNKATKTIIFNTDLFSPFTTFSIFGSSATLTPPPPSGGGGSTGAPILNTSVTLSGRAYPGSTVTILKDAVIAATIYVGNDAKFSASVGGLSGETYLFSVYARDSNGNRSSITNIPVFVTSGVNLKESGIFLAPTLEVNKSEVKRGDPIRVFGQTTPGGVVTISVHSAHPLFFQTPSDKNGVYSYSFLTTPLEIGQHTTNVRSSTNGDISRTSSSVSFAVGTQNIEKTSTKQHKLLLGDVNHDGKVNLIDFSIESFWYNKLNPPSAYDFNGDGVVNIVDFSIMASNWTG